MKSHQDKNKNKKTFFQDPVVMFQTSTRGVPYSLKKHNMLTAYMFTRSFRHGQYLCFMLSQSDYLFSRSLKFFTRTIPDSNIASVLFDEVQNSGNPGQHGGVAGVRAAPAQGHYSHLSTKCQLATIISDKYRGKLSHCQQHLNLTSNGFFTDDRKCKKHLVVISCMIGPPYQGSLSSKKLPKQYCHHQVA